MDRLELVKRETGRSSESQRFWDFVVSGTSLHDLMSDTDDVDVSCGVQTGVFGDIFFASHRRDIWYAFRGARPPPIEREKFPFWPAPKWRHPYPEDGRLPMFVCPVCGDEYCGVHSFAPTFGETRIVWSDFRYEYSSFLDDDVPHRFSEIGPFEFDRAQYEAALACAYPEKV